MNDQHVMTTARLFLQAASDAGHWISPDGRVGLATAAWLVGISPGHMRNLLSEGKGPTTYGTAGGGHKRSVRLLALAEWLEGRRSEGAAFVTVCHGARRHIGTP